MNPRTEMLSLSIYSDLPHYEIHPAAELFPAMTEEELAGLVQDIQENGQREPAMLLQGKLVDGRNRMAACERLNINLDVCELGPDEDPVKWVLSRNLHRRHLDASQKSMVAVMVKKLLESEAQQRSDQNLKKGREIPDPVILPARGDTRDLAAAAVGVSGKLVDSAVKVTERGTPELQAAVTAGKVSVTRAAKIADAPKGQQAALIAKPRRARNGTERKDLDKAIEGLFGELRRKLHSRYEVVGGAGYKAANDLLNDAHKAWLAWQADVAK